MIRSCITVMMPATYRVALATFACAVLSSILTQAQPKMVGIAVLPADTFWPSLATKETGQFIVPSNKKATPFTKDPIQGVSGIVFEGTMRGLDQGKVIQIPMYKTTGLGERFKVLSDNGYGSKSNSADYGLRMYTMDVDFKTVKGGSGKIGIVDVGYIIDSKRKTGFPIVADATFYPNGNNDIKVDSMLKYYRILTGADFDVESICKLPDGSYFLGDEFGPYLLHVDMDKQLMEPPIPLPGVMSPQNPYLVDARPNLPESGGFEGMAINKSGTKLYPMLEKSLEGQEKQLNIYEYDLEKKSFTHTDPYLPPYKYQLGELGTAIGELIAVSDSIFLVIERDDQQGSDAKWKKVFKLNLNRKDSKGFLIKEEVIDLLHISDPDNLSGSGNGFYSLPFVTIEALAVINNQTICVVNDNNYPFSVGRHEDTGAPDDTEFIKIQLEKPMY